MAEHYIHTVVVEPVDLYQISLKFAQILTYGGSCFGNSKTNLLKFLRSTKSLSKVKTFLLEIGHDGYKKFWLWKCFFEWQNATKTS